MSSAKTKAIGLGIGLLVITALLGGVMAYKQVEEGHVGVEKHWGAVTGTNLEPGAQWKVPVMTSIQDVDVRPQTYTMSDTKSEGDKSRADAITVKTVNGSSVDVDVTVRYRVNKDKADEFVEVWNNQRQMEQRLIRPTIRTVLRDEASQLETTGEGAIYTQAGRQALEQAALTALEEDFADEPIVLEAVQIRNIDLPSEIDTALDEKEEAKQMVQVEQKRVAQEEARAEQKIVKAEADAKTIKIRGEALEQNEIVLKDRYIDALKNGETVYVGADNGIALTKDVDAGNETASP